MSFELNLSGTFEIKRGKEVLSRNIPTTSAAILLLILVESQNEWIDRNYIAQCIYPKSSPQASANALRQTLFRLKGWLGEGIVESKRGCLKLTGRWKLVCPPTNQRHNIAPGLNHDYLDRYRVTKSPAKEYGPTPINSNLGELFHTISESDKEISRELLISGMSLLESCNRECIQNILIHAKPNRATDFLAAEYLRVSSFQSVRFGDLAGAIKDAERAYRIARHNHHRVGMAESAAISMFCNLEAGRMNQAKNWLGILQQSERVADTRLLVYNAECAFYWNSGNLTQAQQVLDIGASEIASVRRTKLHFYSNASVFYAEATHFDRAQQCLVEAKKLLQPKIDRWQNQIVQIAENEIKLGLKKFDGLIESINNVKSIAVNEDFQTIVPYALSQSARFYAAQGETGLATLAWNQLEKLRRRNGTSLTPRLLKQRQQAFQRDLS